MRVAVSNIAWRMSEEDEVARWLQVAGVRGVEVAPSKIGPRPGELTDDEVRRYRAFWNERGIEVVAMQALLFGTQGLHLFESEASRRALIDYLRRIVRIGGLLGARALVFGSPRNRLVGTLPATEVERISETVFRELGAVAADAGTCLCIEPNPPEYGADWIRTGREALELVLRVDHPGFGLHLDGGALHLAGEGEEVIRACRGRIRHFHASQPNLAPLRGGGPVPHDLYARVLRSIGYPNWVSVEMRAVPDAPSSLPHVTAAIDFAQSTYGD